MKQPDERRGQPNRNTAADALAKRIADTVLEGSLLELARRTNGRKACRVARSKRRNNQWTAE